MIQFDQISNGKNKQKLKYDLIFDESSQNKQNVSKINCKNVINNILFLLLITLIGLFSINANNIAQNLIQFPILGETITFRPPNQIYKITIHYYCSDKFDPRYPTIILQHGGGGNLVSFLPLSKQLQQKGIRICAYDRLGYGRSSKLIPNLTLKQHSQIINFMIDRILRPDTKIVYGGWSAGVELSMAYSYYYPQRVVGLIFIDGYPDYHYLEAIENNSSTISSHKQLLISKIFRFLEPYGLDQFFGKNQINDTKLNNNYQAYYHTGYLWDSQSTQLKYMSGTAELCEAAKQQKAPIPYPQAKIYLNWPNIKVPLLIMSANKTIGGDQGRKYKQQANKYIEKCTNPIKRMQIIDGDHGFVLVEQKKVAGIIDKFIQEIC